MPHANNRQAIQAAFEGEGVTFSEEGCVCFPSPEQQMAAEIREYRENVEAYNMRGAERTASDPQGGRAQEDRFLEAVEGPQKKQDG